MTLGVEYRDLPAFPGYRVGNDGSVWSCRTPKSGHLRAAWKRLACTVDKVTGYARVSLRKDGSTVRKAVHCLVLEAFVGPRPSEMEACHFPDPDRTNNRLDNLRWDTASGNQMDRVPHGTSNRGERQHMAKLSSQDVLEMIEVRASVPNATYEALGILYGVSEMTIANIFQGHNWSWLTGITPSPRKRERPR